MKLDIAVLSLLKEWFAVVAVEVGAPLGRAVDVPTDLSDTCTNRSFSIRYHHV